MLSTEHAFQVAGARIAKLTLSILPARLDATGKARDLLDIATGEQFSAEPERKIGTEEEDLLDTQSKLYCLTHHVLGVAQKLKGGVCQDAGPEFRITVASRCVDLIRGTI